LRAQTPSDPSAARRLDPAAIPVWILEGAGRALVPFLFVLLAGGDAAWIFAVLLVFGIAGSFVRYQRFSYRLDEGALVVQGGLLQTWRRTIPYARIQTVDVVQKPRHRIFGVVELRIEAAGGTQTEANLSALRPDEAERIRGRLLARTGVPPRPDTETPPLAHLGPRMLLLAGVTGGRVAVLAVLLGYAQEFLSEDTVLRWFERIRDAGGVVAIVAVVAAFLAISIVISVVATIFVYWDFTVRREGDRLVITRGLFERRRAIVPLARLQAIRLDENLVRMAFGLASLTAINAGHARPSQDDKETSLLLPVASRKQALAVASALLDLDAGGLVGSLRRPPGRALIPRLVVGLALGLVVGVAGFALAGQPGVIAFAAVPVGAALAVGSWRMLGASIDRETYVVRTGVLVRRTLLVPVEKKQHLSLTVSPVQRALSLATLRVAIPRAVGRAVHLPRERAEAGYALLSAG
jgi:putative membrane protein